MSERKVLNKYYPPDFDPSKIPRLRLPKERQYTVRLMAPCNMRCTTCGEYIYKGKKFNARKETVNNEEYLGIKIYRFYIKCPRCLAEITFKTDPENADYIVEHGASRNFQALKLAEEAAAREAKEKEEEEKNNPMKLLENRTKASKNEMEALEALEEIRDLNQRHAKVDFEKLLHQNHMKLVTEQERQEAEDEAFINSVFLDSAGVKVKRLTEIDETPKEIQFVKSSFDKSSDFSVSEENPQKKFKSDSSVSARQKSLESLRKAVKVKSSSSCSSSETIVNSSKEEISNEKSIKPTGNNLSIQKSNLSALIAYSDSDSNNSDSS